MTIMYLNISLEIITNHYGIFWFGACEFTGLQENVLMWFLIWFLSTNKNHVKKLIRLACVELSSLNLQAWNAPMNHEGEAKSALVLHSLEKNLKCTRQSQV
jgi:hypothetical protein